MGKIDCGHYVPVPVEITPETLVVDPCQSVSKLVLIQHAEDIVPFRHLVVGENAKADVVFVIFPGVSVDFPIDVDVVGRNAEVSLSGVYICGSDERVNISTQMRHVCEDCKSTQIINGIASGKAQASFYGRIVIAPDAQRIEAYQTNRNLLLSEDAVINTKPQLEIYADDVKCSHGATIGKLNEDELFYMRSRGIPEAEARVLQMISFLTPILEHIADEKQREEIASLVEAAIRGIA